MATAPDQVSPPEFSLSAGSVDDLGDVAAIALPVLPATDHSGVVLGPGADEISRSWNVDLVAVAEAAALDGKAGEVATAVGLRSGAGDDQAAVLLVLVGVGEQTATEIRRAAATLARAVRDRSRLVTTLGVGLESHLLRELVIGMVLGSFGFHRRGQTPPARPVGHVVLAGMSEPESVVAEVVRARAIAGAAWQSRWLATVPANVKTPAWLAERAEQTAEAAGLAVRVWSEADLRRQGFGGICGVGQASDSPPRLIRLDYEPAGHRSRKRPPRVVLVGKGITFDSGGLSVKPGEAMLAMKRDMTGGGVVIAVLGALAAVGCAVRVTGLIPAAENAISASAMRPGDVVRHYGGRTSEVTNTDAEGRLVLADALAYAVSRLAPSAIVDVATLTGAVKIALGQRLAGLFSNDDVLASAIHAAGEASGEPMWRLPLCEEYRDKLVSKVADADNAPSGPGAIMAALFLQRFVGDVPWAHLDIASVGDAWTDSESIGGEWTPGPTGFGARALLAWLGRPDPLAGIADR
ncbi:MAG: leucyl aminopeptidase family protein [Nocardioides sp.]